MQKKTKKPEVDNVTKTEVSFANFVAEHNLPFLVADHFTELAPKMFPDSNSDIFRLKMLIFYGKKIPLKIPLVGFQNLRVNLTISR